MAKVIIVDDDRTVLELMQNILCNEGHEVALCPKPDFLLKRLVAYSYDLILLDVNMPQKSGFELLKLLKSHKEYRRIPVIMVTGEDEGAALSSCFELGAIDYIQKPFHQQVLLSRVNSALNTYSYISALVNDLQSKMISQEKTLLLFKRYVPEQIVEKVLTLNEDSLFDGENLNVSVLFCDIRKFTNLSEKLHPKKVVSLLNDYYRLMTECVQRNKGAVNQFVGDEVFAVFGAPIQINNHAVKAVKCAIEMLDKIQILNEKYSKLIGFPIQIGIGINTGEVVAGNLGTAEVLKYGVTGDTVNTGKRIESFTKNTPNSILISEITHQLTSHVASFNKWQGVKLRGKEKTLNLFQYVAK